MKNYPINKAVDRFLFNYRIIPHSVKGLSPAEILMNRKLNSNLKILKPYHDTYHTLHKKLSFPLRVFFGKRNQIRRSPCWK